MKEKIVELKKLNLAYIAALEYDYCPEPDKANEFIENYDVFTYDQAAESFEENQGRRPDEIAGEISDFIKELS